MLRKLTLEKMPNLLALATLPVYETVIFSSEIGHMP
jgi:hypothetical protein